MIKKILIGLALALVALCGVIATRPSTYSVQRSATFKASPDIAFALVNDFHQWKGWSPWEKLDPSMKLTFDGPVSGAGARYGWTGNDQVGEGRMTIEESKASEAIRIKLEFVKPWASTSDTFFTFSPVADGVSVTWRMTGDNDFMGKAMSLVMDMDSMIGKDFDNGLAAMGKLAEAEALARAEAQKVAAQAAPPAEAPAAPASGEAVAVPTP